MNYPPTSVGGIFVQNAHSLSVVAGAACYEVGLVGDRFRGWIFVQTFYPPTSRFSQARAALQSRFTSSSTVSPLI